MPAPESGAIVDGTIAAENITTGTLTIQAGTWLIQTSSTAPTGGATQIQVVQNGQIIYPPTRFVTNSTTTGYLLSPFDTATTTNTVIVSNGTTYWTGNVWTSTSGNYINTPVDWSQVRKMVAPVVKKSTKSAIKRALKLMIGMGFEEDVRIFLNGDSIEVAHPDSLLKFVITKYNDSLIRRTEYPGYSTPYKLELYTKSNVHVANLCVYMKETPVLDQVLGVAMFIKSGSEEMILKQANWSSLTSDMELREILALEYPYLTDKLRLSERRIQDLQGNYLNGVIDGNLIVAGQLELRP